MACCYLARGARWEANQQRQASKPSLCRGWSGLGKKGRDGTGVGRGRALPTCWHTARQGEAGWRRDVEGGGCGIPRETMGAAAPTNSGTSPAVGARQHIWGSSSGNERRGGGGGAVRSRPVPSRRRWPRIDQPGALGCSPVPSPHPQGSRSAILAPARSAPARGEQHPARIPLAKHALPTRKQQLI